MNDIHRIQLICDHCSPPTGLFLNVKVGSIICDFVCFFCGKRTEVKSIPTANSAGTVT